MKHKIVNWLTLVLIAGLLITLHDEPASFVLCTMNVLVARILLLVYGSYRLQSNYFIHSYHKGESGIALTFDDGPDPALTPVILDILEKNRIRAAFFLIGHKAEKFPALVKEIHDRGHIVANHSYSHSRRIGLFRSRKLKADLASCSAVIAGITGMYPALFRPPFGVTNPRYRAALEQNRLSSIGWSIRSYDTVEKDPARLEAKIAAKIKPGSVLLLHDDRKVASEALPGIIRECIQKGVPFVSLEEMFLIKPYHEK